MKSHIRKLLCASILFCISFGATTAQNADYQKPPAFPYQLSSYREAGLMVLGTAMLYTSGFTHRKLEPINEVGLANLNIEKIPFVDRWTTTQWNPKLNVLREILEPVGIAAAAGVVGGIGLKYKADAFTWYPLMTLTMMYFEGFYISEGGVLLMKSLAKRARPYTYNAELSLDQRLSSGNNESFFSGNATVMFFNATFISQVLSDVFPEKRWTPYVWAGTHGLAFISGIWSVQSGNHYPTDVLVGALWGSGIALLTTKLHRVNTKLAILPFANSYGKGISLNYAIPYH